jgi:predicted TIM-barrel fold metal-dependent hydrolase
MIRKFNYSIIGLCIISLLFFSLNLFAQLDYLMSIKKIDAHVHIRSDAPYLRKILDDLNMKFCTICTGGLNLDRMNFQINVAKEITKEYPRYYAWLTTFDLTQRDDPDWADNVIKQLKEDFKNGAVGVKIWKDIGMEIKNAEGEYIQVDDPMFEPIFNFIEQEGKTVLAHLGEPIQAWMVPYLPVEGVPGNYWTKHPEYSFWDKPELPSYNDIMAARDHVLERHPNLKFVGAHLGSLEFDVEEIIKRFDRYPNFAVGIGGRTRYLMWQARGKIREFFIKYQDRIMYGTDRSGGLIGRNGKAATPEDIEKSKSLILYRHDLFFRYYATDEEIPWGNYIYSDKPQPKPTYTVRGLALPKEVLDKVFYKNAIMWFPEIEKDF